MGTTLTIEPLTTTIGAELGGVDLVDDLSDETIAAIRAALLDWKVIFFRDQHRLGRDEHVAFGRRFGDLEVHPLTPEGQSHPEVFVLPSGGKHGAPGVWHSDVTWRPEPSMGSILRAVDLPPLGGDTLWADMHAAYELLDDATKEQVDGLVALHDYARTFGFGQGPEVQARMRAEHPTVEHPIVRTHPETGAKAIYVNAGFTCGIKGMDGEASRALLKRLEHQAWLPDVQCRFRWRPGSVAFWDNRATQHSVVGDYGNQPRVIQRITLVGDQPV
jgi:taurine dioxygenase